MTKFNTKKEINFNKFNKMILKVSIWFFRVISTKKRICEYEDSYSIIEYFFQMLNFVIW